ncbi:uncharacterized protein LOC143181482 isoform X1 [Calliopsis andreniformis]|uniref:uncharacterized protein LOC143181482 isoform X1 n=1 Tax=Calliopsis andreniformis TaxID=337506 RepID=UPI003FCE0322
MDQYRHGYHDRRVDHHRPVLHRPREVPKAPRGLLRLLTHPAPALVGVLVVQPRDARRLLQPDHVEGEAEGLLHHRLTLKSRRD